MRLYCNVAGHGKGIPEGTPYLKGELPDEEKPQALWSLGVVDAGLKLLVGTIRCVLVCSADHGLLVYWTLIIGKNAGSG